MKSNWFKHLWFWIPYLILEVYTEAYWMEVQYHQPYWSTLYHAFLEEFLQMVVIKMPMVYLMIYFIEQFAHKKKNYILLFISLAGTLLLFTWFGYIFLLHVIVPYVYPHLEIVGLGGSPTMVNSFMDKIFVSSAVIAINEYLYSQKLREREKELLKEKVETELNFLKAQINPHFLFNTLNNIYALARKKSDETSDVVMKLSKLLRFVLYETNSKQIPIEKEAEFLKNYIDIEKIRFNDRLNVSYTKSIDDPQTLIMPMCMIPLVENAFKHGASQSTQHAFINIDLNLKDKKFELNVVNSFEGNDDGNETGIGLKNLKRQLELCYKNFELDTKKSENEFHSKLVIYL